MICSQCGWSANTTPVCTKCGKDHTIRADIQESFRKDCIKYGHLAMYADKWDKEALALHAQGMCKQMQRSGQEPELVLQYKEATAELTEEAGL